MTVQAVTVQYVNQPKPGKKMGSIKDDKGTYYNVWPDKLPMFKPNATYKVEVETNEQGFHTIKGIIQDAAPQAPQTGGGQSRDMFAMGFINRRWHGSWEAPVDPDVLASELTIALHAWDKSHK